MNKKKSIPLTQYHHGDLKNSLIKEGRGLIEEKGVSELSLREVARRVGVSEAAPSKHFSGKLALLAAIAAEGFQELAKERMKIAATHQTLLDKSRAMMRSYVDYARKNKGVFNLMVGPRLLEAQEYPELMQASSISFDIFASTIKSLAIERGWSKNKLELVIHSAWAMEHGLATLIIANRAPRSTKNLSLNKVIDFSIELILLGISQAPDEV